VDTPHTNPSRTTPPEPELGSHPKRKRGRSWKILTVMRGRIFHDLGGSALAGELHLVLLEVDRALQPAARDRDRQRRRLAAGELRARGRREDLDRPRPGGAVTPHVHRAEPGDLAPADRLVELEVDEREVDHAGAGDGSMHRGTAGLRGEARDRVDGGGD